MSTQPRLPHPQITDTPTFTSRCPFYTHPSYILSRPACPCLQSYTIYILYFVVIAQKFQRFRVNTYNLFDLSFSNFSAVFSVPVLFDHPGWSQWQVLVIENQISSIFKRLNIARESPKSLPASTLYIYYIQHILYHHMIEWMPSLACSSTLPLLALYQVCLPGKKRKFCPLFTAAAAADFFLQTAHKTYVFQINFWIALVNFRFSVLIQSSGNLIPIIILKRRNFGFNIFSTAT